MTRGSWGLPRACISRPTVRCASTGSTASACCASVQAPSTAQLCRKAGWSSLGVTAGARACLITGYPALLSLEGSACRVGMRASQRAACAALKQPALTLALVAHGLQSLATPRGLAAASHGICATTATRGYGVGCALQAWPPGCWRRARHPAPFCGVQFEGLPGHTSGLWHSTHPGADSRRACVRMRVQRAAGTGHRRRHRQAVPCAGARTAQLHPGCCCSVFHGAE